MPRLQKVVLGFSLFLAMWTLAYGQTSPSSDTSSSPLPSAPQTTSTTTTATQTPATPQAQPAPKQEVGFGTIGVDVNLSFFLISPGIEAATPVTRKSNVRAGFNAFVYDRTFHEDKNEYDGHISFKTFQAHYDYFPFGGGFHVSGGLLAYFGDPLTATIFAPSFKLNGQEYYPANNVSAITGNGKIDFNAVSPTVTIGFGNIVSRKPNKHFTVPVEFGVAFQGSPKAHLNFANAVLCTSPGVPPTDPSCQATATYTTIQTNIAAEQNKINNDLTVIKAYPIFSIGFGYKF
jgi:hypothetical protein